MGGGFLRPLGPIRQPPLPSCPPRSVVLGRRSLPVLQILVPIVRELSGDLKTATGVVRFADDARVMASGGEHVRHVRIGLQVDPVGRPPTSCP